MRRFCLLQNKTKTSTSGKYCAAFNNVMFLNCPSSDHKWTVTGWVTAECFPVLLFSDTSFFLSQFASLLSGPERQDREAERRGSCRQRSEPGGQHVGEPGEERLGVGSGAEGAGKPPLSQPQVPGGLRLLQQSHSKEQVMGTCVSVSVSLSKSMFLPKISLSMVLPSYCSSWWCEVIQSEVS